MYARLGPDLSNLKTQLSPEQLVDSILRPSDLIDKAYGQVSVLTVDGKIETGIRIAEDDSQIVLRNLAAPEPIAIRQEDVEDVIDSKVSLMPANLTRQLKSRQEFEDLMKYILEIRQP